MSLNRNTMPRTSPDRALAESAVSVSKIEAIERCGRLINGKEGGALRRSRIVIDVVENDLRECSQLVR